MMSPSKKLQFTACKTTVVSLICCSLVLSPGPTQAFEFKFGASASALLHVKAGIDESTQRFIESLVPEIREQVVQLIKEAMPLIDKSIKSYIEAIDGVLDKQVNHLQCVALGAGKALGVEMKSALPFVGPPEPVSKLAADQSKMISGFSRNTTPVVYSHRYGDFLYRAASAACQVSISPEALVDVRAIQDDVRPRWSTWNRLVNVCNDAHSCAEMQLAELDKEISKADIRDLKEVDAENWRQSIKIPSKAGFFSNWDPSQYEKTLISIDDLRNSIKLSYEIRELVAKYYVDQAEGKLNQAIGDLKFAAGHFSDDDEDPNRGVIASSQASKGLLKEVDDRCLEAEKLTETQSERCSGFSKTSSEQSNFANSLIIEAVDKNNIIESRINMERMRERSGKAIH